MGVSVRGVGWIGWAWVGWMNECSPLSLPSTDQDSDAFFAGGTHGTLFFHPHAPPTHPTATRHQAKEDVEPGGGGAFGAAFDRPQASSLCVC